MNKVSEIIKGNKPLSDFIKKVQRASANGGRKFTVTVDDETISITYYTKHGGEECVEVPYKNLTNREIAEWFLNEWNNYDVSAEVYRWLDDTGHGKDGAPHEMEEVLADKKEWYKRLDWLMDAAVKLLA